MSLHRLLGFEVAVPDPEGLAAFYTELGLSGDATTGFTGTDGGAGVRLAEGSFRQLRSVAIGAESERDLTTARQRLAELGVEATLAHGSLQVVDPATSVRFELEVAAALPAQAPTSLVIPNAPGATQRANRRAPAVFDEARPPRRLGHLVIGSPDLAGTVRLLVEGLGFKLSDSVEGVIAFLRCSTDHHNVAVVDSPVPMLQHYSFECDDIDHLGHAGTKLYRADPERQAWGIGRHFAGSNFYWYLTDPSGAFLELYSDLDQILDDEEWERSGRTDFAVEQVANAWGPNIPLEFIAPPDLERLAGHWGSRP